MLVERSHRGAARLHSDAQHLLKRSAAEPPPNVRKLRGGKATHGVIKELEQRYSQKTADARDLAVAFAGFADKEKAFEWLEKAYADHSVFLVFLRLEPLMEPLHSDPRWNDLDHRVGMTS